MKDKMTAALLAFFLGGIGIHKFYLGQTALGFVYLLFCWTLIPGIIAFFEFIFLLVMDQAEFDRRYNHGARAGYGGPQQIHIHNTPYQQPYGQSPQQPYTPPQPNAHNQGPEPFPSPFAAGPSPMRGDPSPTSPSVADELKKLHELRVAGVLTEDEFRAHKQKLLSQ